MGKNLSSLAVGDKIKFGTFQGDEIIWVAADKNHKDYPADSVTFVSKYVLKLMPFDAAETSNRNEDRRKYGNNRYRDSNIRQWMNSAADAGEWYHAQHSADAPPIKENIYSESNEYYHEAGFLNEFTAVEQKAILNTTVDVKKHDEDGGDYETVTDKIFLFSCTEIGIEGKFDNKEGCPLALFESPRDRWAYPTARAVRDNECDQTRLIEDLSTNSPWHWMLRSCVVFDAEKSWDSSYVELGVYGPHCYSPLHGLRPAMNLSSDLLISDSTDSDGCYTVVFNQAPSAPASITVPEKVMGGQNLVVTWEKAVDTDGNLSGYCLERRYDGGAFEQIYKGTNTAFEDTILIGWTSVQYRVKAYDTDDAESTYTVSTARTVVNNRNPVISGNDDNLGSFDSEPLRYAYTVTDEDEQKVTVTEQLDDTQIRAFTVTLGNENTCTFSDLEWQKIRNGNHTLTITATDSMGAETKRVLTFSKNVTRVALVTDTQPAAQMPMKAIVNLQGKFPTGCELTVEICNNGNDVNPSWENITFKALNMQKHFFRNQTKTAETWGVALRVTLDRGTATGDCCISSIKGNFG